MSDKCALVTGASSGIGRALAQELASRGYDLIISSAGERLDAVTAELAQRGVQVVEAKADLATKDGVSALWSEVESTGKKLDIACINAGIGVGGTVCRDRSRNGVKHDQPQLCRYSATSKVCSETYAFKK